MFNATENVMYKLGLRFSNAIYKVKKPLWKLKKKWNERFRHHFFILKVVLTPKNKTLWNFNYRILMYCYVRCNFKNNSGVYFLPTLFKIWIDNLKTQRASCYSKLRQLAYSSIKGRLMENYIFFEIKVHAYV